MLYCSDGKWQWKYTNAMIEGEGSMSQYVVLIAYICSSPATLETYLHAILWLLWSTIDFIHGAILPLYWGLVNGALSTIEAI